MQVISRLYVAAAVAVMAYIGAGAAWAGMGQPSDWQIGPQQSATPVMDDIVWFHNYLLVFITVIALFVLALLAIVIPSFKFLFFQLNTPPADLTVKATGKQWFWSYSYPDNGKFEFDSLMLSDKERRAKTDKDPKADVPRLLAVDNELVVPVNKVVRVQVIGADVIHAFAVPSFGIKIDAISGRLNETWFKAEREGVYYGQCSELCGKNHAFMPISVHVVSDQEFTAWVEEAKKKYARADGPTTVAAATPE